jgi:hypothetical protein
MSLAVGAGRPATDDRFSDQPLIEAGTGQAVARWYGEMTRFMEGKRHSRRAMALRDEHLVLDHRETREPMELSERTYR